MSSPHGATDDVLVVGGGVIGLAVAHELASRGRSVRVLERGRLTDGTSLGNGGLVTPSHAMPLTRPGMVRQVLAWMLDPNAPIFVRPSRLPWLLGFGRRFQRSCRADRLEPTLHARAALLASSRATFADWVEGQGFDCQWETSGLLLAFAERASFDAEAAVHGPLAEHGIEAHCLDARELRAREPLLRDDLAGGAFYPGDAQLRPEDLMRELAQRVRAAGGTIEEGVTVQGFEHGQSGVSALRTDRGPRPASHVVLATGAWSPVLGKQLGLRLAVEPGRGYSLTFESIGDATGKDPAPERPRTPLILEEAAMGVSSWPSGLRLSGTVEFSGFEARQRPDRLAALRAGSERFLQLDLLERPAVEWMGLRPMTPDELPVIGPAPRQPNVFVATGHGRMGVSMAPATGRLVAELLVGETPHVDPAPYAPTRFG